MDPSDVVHIQPLLKAILDGGPAAIASILLLDMLIIIVISHYVIKLVLRSAKDQVDVRERILKEKEILLEARTLKLEEIIDRYHNTQIRIVEALEHTQAVLSEIKTRIAYITEDDK